MSVWIEAGGGENVTPEVTVQTPLVQEILESLVGKVTLANATPETILEGYSAYVGQKLVKGTLEDMSQLIDFGTVTVSEATSITANHSLKKTPSYVMLLPKSVNSATNVFLSSVAGSAPLIAGSSYKLLATYVYNAVMEAERLNNENSYKVTCDESSVTFKAGDPYKAKGTYLWVVIA